MFTPRRILVPTDFSDHSDDALREALDLARQYHAKVYLLHVNNPIRHCAGDYCPDYSAIRQAEDAEALAARERMQQELKKFPEFREIEIISDIREGETVKEILKEQEEREVDLIVMPSHGKTGLLKRLMGNISEKVTEEAKSEVLLVRH